VCEYKLLHHFYLYWDRSMIPPKTALRALDSVTSALEGLMLRYLGSQDYYSLEGIVYKLRKLARSTSSLLTMQSPYLTGGYY